MGILPLGVILLSYFGKVTFRLPGLKLAIPGGLMAIVLGTSLAWITGLVTWDAQQVEAAIAP
ncbi:hypothetical protein NON20_16340 [Synechocystis sp. B12]|nr:hypothetical protein NON20_16340 [Synechocystis sp. B12]